MSYLLAISLGPVQDFIMAARRTADLQAGSDLLVEIARAAARAVLEACEPLAPGTDASSPLVFPADLDTGGSNKILAHINGDPARIAQAAEEAARKHLREAWNEARSAIPEDVPVDGKLAEDQIGHFLEFYAAWEPLDGDYKEARETVERRLAGRKALREFQHPRSAAGIPKSPLDPSRDCVIQMGGSLTVPDACNRDPLWLKPRETLDAVSILKRIKGVRDAARHGVPSTTDVAVRAILPAAKRKAPGNLEALDAIQKEVRELDLGTCFFSSRTDEALERHDDAENVKERIAMHREAILDALGLSEAPPYLAILTADGDRMGETLSRFDESGHRRVSGALTGFVAEARQIVHRHDGHLIYAGGDDTLALLPVTTATECAFHLEEAFRLAMSPLGDASTPTLSVGIAVVHHLESLQISVQRAREAEKAAKVKRNSLAVALHTRGGGPVTVALEWPAEEWKTWANAFARGLTRGLPYELRDLAKDFQCAQLADPTRQPQRLRDEAERIIKRKDPEKKVNAPSPPGWVIDSESLKEFARLLVISRFLAVYKEALDA